MENENVLRIDDRNDLAPGNYEILKTNTIVFTAFPEGREFLKKFNRQAK